MEIRRTVIQEKADQNSQKHGHNLGNVSKEEQQLSFIDTDLTERMAGREKKKDGQKMGLVEGISQRIILAIRQLWRGQFQLGTEGWSETQRKKDNDFLRIGAKKLG